MTKRLKHNLYTWGLYSGFISIILIPIKISFLQILSISILLGFLFGCLNEIIFQLRKMNGEKFPTLED